MYWIIVGGISVVLVAAYVAVFFYGRKRQKSFDAQYNAAKQRHEVFVLGKKISRERPNTRLGRFIKLKTYHVTGRVSVSQAVRGMQMSRMQTVTFQTTKQEYEKIQLNHKYKMDIAGNYIGYVMAPPPAKESLKAKARFKWRKSAAAKPNKRGKA